MYMIDTAAQEQVQKILARATDLTLATVRADGGPHATTVSFVSDGLAIYAAIAIDCAKAHELHHDARIAATVNLPYADWSEIQGLSIIGAAGFVTDRDELQHVAALLLRKLPQYNSVIGRPDIVPWPGLLFIRIEPASLTIIDYTRGFGHATHHQVHAPRS